MVDNTAPVITVTDAGVTAVAFGGSWSDPGATATDAVDGGVTINIAGDSVDPNDPVGSVFTITYDAVHAAGNIAAQATRTVIDTAPPVITVTNPALTTVEFAGTWTDPSATATDLVEGALAVTTGGDTVNPSASLGAVFTVTYDAMDAAGNTALQVFRMVAVAVVAAPGEGEGASARENATADQDGDGLTDCLECELNLNPESTDTDGDGMSDSYEVDNNLEALIDDASNDLDGDGFTNLEEFLRGTDPTDPTSPSSVFFVSPSGLDIAARGSEAAPWETLGFALDQVPQSSANPVRINVAAGTYTENINLLPGLTLAAVLDNVVIISGTVLGANESTLIDIEIVANPATQNTPLLELDNVAMNVIGVTFRGTDARTETAIRVTGVTSSRSVIESCTFTSLGIEIDIVRAIPIIRRSLFEVIADTGIVLRATGVALSQDTDATSGIDIFDIPSIGRLAIHDQSSENFPVQINDWGTDDLALIEASISGQNEYRPFLGRGRAILASALFIVVVDAVSQNSVTNCSIALTPSALEPATDNVGGV